MYNFYVEEKKKKILQERQLTEEKESKIRKHRQSKFFLSKTIKGILPELINKYQSRVENFVFDVCNSHKKS